MNDMIEISFREQIRLNLVSAMERSDVTQVQLAERLGISKGTVNNWVKGNNSPDVEIMPKICDALGIQISEFFSSPQFANFENANKKPALVSEDGLDREIINRLCQLTPAELQRVDDFVRGLLASR